MTLLFPRRVKQSDGTYKVLHPLPEILDVGDGASITRQQGLAAAALVIRATEAVLEEQPLSELGLDIATDNLAHVLGGPEWAEHADDLIEASING